MKTQAQKKTWLSLMTEVLTPKENSKKQIDNIKTPPKASILQRLRTDWWKSVGVTTATQFVWINKFTGSNPSHLLQKLCNQKDTHIKFVNNSPYTDRGPTSNQSREDIKIITHTSKVIGSISKISKNIR